MAEKPIDLIIMDLKMPGVHDLEAIERIRENNKPIEISKDIGVSMIYQTGKGIISKSSGYNFKFTENELTSNHNKN